MSMHILNAKMFLKMAALFTVLLFSSVAHADLWDRVVKGYQLNPDDGAERIVKQLQWYRKYPHYLRRVSVRGERYMFHILKRIEEEGMPTELALVPVIESAYDPFAYSAGRASGLWQFVPLTARHVGLKRNWWYDGRRDIVAATDAAIGYLKELNGRFDGDWLLTLAAYNSGATTVNRAIRANKKKGLPVDYWSLKLPKETEGYVPKLLALAEIVKNPATYNIERPVIPNAPYFAAVDIGSQIDLAQAADLAGITMDELYHLNPAFNRWATDPDGPHRLLVPYHKALQFKQSLAALPKDQRISWVRYKVKSGDSLSVIAHQHGTNVRSIQEANELRNNTIRIGQIILVPGASRNAEHYSYSSEQRLASVHQRAAHAGMQRRVHKVESGDSLWLLARQYKVSISQITKWNNISPRQPIKRGQKLVIWTKASTSSKNVPGGGLIRRVGYTVRNGDSLSHIASRFNVAVNDIVTWNSINSSKYLQPGQRLTLYVDVTRTH